MEFITHMEQRYTTKKYDASQKIDAKTIEQLKRILHLSPSSINSQPWKFSFVENSEIKSQLADASLFNREKVLDASHVIVFSVMGKTELFEQHIEKWLPEGAVNYYNNMIKHLPEEEIISWLSKQVYLSLGVFLSACASMGIDSTPMEGIETEKYAEILGYDDYRPLVAVAIGKRNVADLNQPSMRPKSRVPEDLVIDQY